MQICCSDNPNAMFVDTGSPWVVVYECPSKPHNKKMNNQKLLADDWLLLKHNRTNGKG